MAKPWRVVAWSAGALLAASPLALLLWWLPARAEPGYYLPDTRGVVTAAPPDVIAFWVRPWPWNTQPPPATVILDLPGGQIPVPAAAASVSFFAPRAVAVDLSLNGGSPVEEAGNIASIGMVWSGSRATFRRMRDLWAMPAQPTQAIPGFAPLVTAATGGDWPLAVSLSSVPGDVLAVAAANPTQGPWLAPRCLSVRDAADAPQGTPQRLRSLLDAMTAGACRPLKGPGGLILAGRPPAGPLAYIFEPILEVRSEGRTTTLAQADFESGTGMTATAFDWWRFVQLPR